MSTVRTEIDSSMQLIGKTILIAIVILSMSPMFHKALVGGA
jgi:hypothetical protein